MTFSFRIFLWFAAAPVTTVSSLPAPITVFATVSEHIGLEETGYDSGACDWVAQSIHFSPRHFDFIDIVIQNYGGCQSAIEEVRFY
jgi:hypothetical protein